MKESAKGRFFENILKKCYGIGATIRIGPEIQCLRNAGFLDENH